MILRIELACLFRVMGVLKYQEITGNLPQFRPDEITNELTRQIKLGAIRYDGKHFWTTED